MRPDQDGAAAQGGDVRQGRPLRRVARGDAGGVLDEAPVMARPRDLGRDDVESADFVASGRLRKASARRSTIRDRVLSVIVISDMLHPFGSRRLVETAALGLFATPG